MLSACGNGTPPGYEPFTYNGCLVIPPTPLTCTKKGETVYVCDAKLYTPTANPDTDKALANVLKTFCGSTKDAVVLAFATVLDGIIQGQPDKFNGNRVKYRCGDTQLKSYTPPVNRPPGAMPLGFGGALGSEVTEDGECGPDDWNGDESTFIVDAGAPSTCEATGSVSTCSTCAATSCCPQRTACDADDTPGKAGSCGCWTECEAAGFSVEQCGQPVDPSGPSSCGPQDSITSSYDACLHINCPSCGPSGVEPIGVHVGYLGAASR